MNIKQIEKILTEGGIEPNEAKIEAKMLLKHLGANEIDLLSPGQIKDEIWREAAALARLRASKRIPIQHIIGVANFMGEDFIVNEHVLIPRDETELLVYKAIELIKSNKMENILDIGTGSGCIACMTAKLSGAKAIGLDISTDALQIALKNAEKLDLCNKALFRKSDIFSNVKQGEKFDLIISNPPYIPPKEKANLQKEVHFDPEIALFASDEDGVEFYRKISFEAPEFLNPGGFLIFEIGIGQVSKVKEIMKEAGFSEIEITKDLAGIERVIWGKI